MLQRSRTTGVLVVDYVLVTFLQQSKSEIPVDQTLRRLKEIEFNQPWSVEVEYRRGSYLEFFTKYLYSWDALRYYRERMYDSQSSEQASVCPACCKD